MTYKATTIGMLQTGNMFRLPNDTAVYIRIKSSVTLDDKPLANSVSLVNGEIYCIPKDQQIYKITRDSLRIHVSIQTMVCDVPMGAKFTIDDKDDTVFIRCEGATSPEQLMCFNTKHGKDWPMYPSAEVTLCQ